MYNCNVFPTSHSQVSASNLQRSTNCNITQPESKWATSDQPPTHLHQPLTNLQPSSIILKSTSNPPPSTSNQPSATSKTHLQPPYHLVQPMTNLWPTYDQPTPCIWRHLVLLDTIFYVNKKLCFGISFLQIKRIKKRRKQKKEFCESIYSASLTQADEEPCDLNQNSECFGSQKFAPRSSGMAEWDTRIIQGASHWSCNGFDSRWHQKVVIVTKRSTLRK